MLASIRVELKKAMKARVIQTTFGIFTVAPLMAGLFIYLLMNPDVSEKTGQLGGQAGLYGEASWQTYTLFFSQILAIGGILVFAFVFSFIFGREFTDRTITDLLVLPYPPSYTVTAKLVTSIVISILLTVYMLVIGFFLGLCLRVPGLSIPILLSGLKDLSIILLMTLALSFPLPFLASLSKGYLLPIGFVLLMIVFAQILTALGLGGYFPWAIPGLYAGLGGVGGYLSHFTIFIVAVLGLISSYVYWIRAEFT